MNKTKHPKKRVFNAMIWYNKPPTKQPKKNKVIMDTLRKMFLLSFFFSSICPGNIAIFLLLTSFTAACFTDTIETIFTGFIAAEIFTMRQFYFFALGTALVSAAGLCGVIPLEVGVFSGRRNHLGNFATP